MKKPYIILFFIILISSFINTCFAGNISQYGLRAMDGESEIELCKGEKIRLYADNGIFGTPKLCEVKFFSMNTYIAYISGDDILHASNVGKVTIVAIAEDGSNDSFDVIVTQRQKPGIFLSIIIMIFLFLLILVLYKKMCK